MPPIIPSRNPMPDSRACCAAAQYRRTLPNPGALPDNLSEIIPSVGLECNCSMHICHTKELKPCNDSDCAQDQTEPGADLRPSMPDGPKGRRDLTPRLAAVPRRELARKGRVRNRVIASR